MNHFLQGLYPKISKLPKVIPIYKTDDAEEFSNYRPVSILSCFSKILERWYSIGVSIILILTTF